MTNSGTVLGFYKALDQRATDHLDQYVAEDFVGHEGATMGITARGPQYWRDLLRALTGPLPDVNWRVDQTVAQADQVWALIEWSATHRGPFQGLAATGRRFAVRQVHMLTMTDGHITQHSAVRDDLGVLTQLGITLPP
jgi:steroid delta-isomerase-like uncharacterized protein